MWQKNGGGRAREGKVSAEARNPTDKECGWVLWAKEGEDVMKSLRIKGPKKKTFWQKPFRMPVRGTGGVSAAERCGSFEILENQGTQKKNVLASAISDASSGSGRVPAAERGGSFEIIVDPSATSTQGGGGKMPRRTVVLNFTSLIFSLINISETTRLY